MTHGKICYLEIPTNDVDKSAAFYSGAFGWKIRTRGDGTRAFDDATGYVSGTGVLGRPVQQEAGITPYIMVENVTDSLSKITEAGGFEVQAYTPHGQGNSGHGLFRDPAGNLMGLYQD